MIPARRAAIVAAVIGIVALAISGSFATLALGVLCIAIIVDALFARHRSRLHRAVAPVLIIGQPTAIRVTSDAVAGSGTVRLRQPRTADLQVEPGEHNGALDAQVTALRRGRHPLPPVAARRTGPSGLGAWDFRGDGDTTVTVYPDVPTALRIAHAVRTKSFADAGEIRRGPLGLGTEFESIRDYQPDDDIRQVNWNATMRVGRSMSNRYRSRRNDK